MVDWRLTWKKSLFCLFVGNAISYINGGINHGPGQWLGYIVGLYVIISYTNWFNLNPEEPKEEKKKKKPQKKGKKK